MNINATDIGFKELNELLRAHPNSKINNCLGQGYIGIGLSEGCVEVFGTPGNALGAYLDGAEIIVHGNVQDAVGDTMNSGKIIVHGNAGDALGLAMRGGKIYVRGNAGYRAGVHMKAYGLVSPTLVIGGGTGSFLGEYLAGGMIVLLNLENQTLLCNFIGAGMHGGKIVLRGTPPPSLPPQLTLTQAHGESLKEVLTEVHAFAATFKLDYASLAEDKYFILSPSVSSPYKRLFVGN